VGGRAGGGRGCTVQSDQQQEAEGGRGHLSRLQWRRGHSQQHSTGAARRSSTAVVPRSHLRPPIKAAIFLSIRGIGSGPSPAVELGEKAASFFNAVISTGRVARLFGSAPPAAKQVRRPTLVATASGAVLARSLVSPSTLPLKPPARLLCCLY
jgi:hypothetical protein